MIEYVILGFVGAGIAIGAGIFFLWSMHKAYLLGYDDAKAGKERCCKE